MEWGLSDEVYTDVEHAAYEAAVLPELWPQVLSRVGEISGSAGGALVCLNERGVNIVCAPALDRVRDRILAEGYMSRSGRAQGVVTMGLVGIPRFLNEDDWYADAADAARDPIVAEVFRPEGFGWAAGWIQSLPHGDTVIMNVEQYWDRGPIKDAALARLDQLYPVFARAAVLGARSQFQRVRASVDTLTELGLPAAAVSPQGRVVFANERFGAAADVWTTGRLDRIALLDPVAAKMLAEVLSTIGNAAVPRSIPCRLLPAGSVHAVIQVIPIRRQAHDLFGSAVAILVLSQTSEKAADARLVQSLFDLTPAEIAVARSIAAGLTVAEISRASGRSVRTVRNQLNSAMAKTGCSRQLELVLLMEQLRHTRG